MRIREHNIISAVAGMGACGSWGGSTVTALQDVSLGPIASARALAPRILVGRPQSEADRELTPDVVEGMREARLFRLWVPRAYGGEETDIATLIAASEELARVDASVAWVAINFVVWTAGVAYLTPEVARPILERADVAVGGSGAAKPGTKAVAVAGGYRVTGRWGVGSGRHHAQWMWVRSPVWDGDTPRQSPEGAPVVIYALVPTPAFNVLDTWHVSAMRGTGSNDFTLTDTFVPEERTLPVPVPICDISALHRIPFLTWNALSGCGGAFGAARGAIDAMVELAAEKTPVGQMKVLRELADVQAAVARAEGILRSARAFALETARELWDTGLRGDEVSLPLRTQARLAATHAMQSAVQVVDLMYTAAGTTAFSESTAIDRCFRDARAMAQATPLAPRSFELIGRALLGLEENL
jgi:alkylation response protein AidB-like acyl-CoA dehydrogenase